MVRTYSILTSNNNSLFTKKREKFNIMKQELKDTKQGQTTTTTIHDSKHFPFQVVEITITENEKEFKNFKIGMCGQFVSNKVFASKETAEKYISARPWELITNMVCLTIQNALEYEKSKSNN